MIHKAIVHRNQDLAWQMGRLNPHDVTRIEACDPVMAQSHGIWMINGYYPMGMTNIAIENDHL